MIKLFSEVIKGLAFGLLIFLFGTVIYKHLVLEKHSYKNTTEIQVNNKLSSLRYSLEVRDSINRIIMPNGYSGKFHEIILPQGTKLKSIKLN